jgi:hypothetical protein
VNPNQTVKKHAGAIVQPSLTIRGRVLRNPLIVRHHQLISAVTAHLLRGVQQFITKIHYSKYRLQTNLPCEMDVDVQQIHILSRINPR